MDKLLLFAALALVVIWTARVARSKGRNPWLWSGSSFLLGIAMLQLAAVASVAPLVILMFLKSPQRQTRSIAPPNACPKCQEISTASSRFCTNCGWELTVTPEAAAEPEKPVITEEPETVVASTAVESAPTDESPPVAVEEAVPEAVPEAATDAAQEGPPTLTAYRTPVPVDAPTAAGMTERGVRLFNQGRIQESIDQFTKAIALDANYIQAWAKRAEAYARLGRGDQAAEDRRRLDALDASSSSG